MTSRVRLIGLLLLAAAFGSTLTSSFHFDDYSLFRDPAVTWPGGWWQLFGLERTRPLTYLTFWLNYQIGGAEPWGYHAVNLALHFLTVGLAAVVFRRVSTPQAALIATAVFALHPLQSEPVAYVFGRATLLSALFCVLCWKAWLDGHRWWAVSWFGAALLAKTEAIAFPAFLAGYEWFRHGRASELRTSWRPLAAMLGLAVAAAGWLFHAARVTAGAGVAFDLGSITPKTYLLTQGRAVWEYLRLVALPAGLHFDRDYRLSTGWDPSTTAAWLALAALLASAVWLARRRREGYWLLGALLLLAPTSSVVPLADLVAERRMYLPLLSLSLGIGVLLAEGLRSAPRALRAYFPLMLAAILAGLSCQRSLVWRSEESLWRDTAEKSPRKIRPKLQLARALAEKGPAGLEERFRLLEDAKALDPGNREVASELGVFYLETGNPEEARQQFEQLLTDSPADAQTRANQGAALYLLGRWEEAMAAFQKALEQDPCNFDARYNLILVHQARGDRAAARQAALLPAGCRFTEQQSQALAAAATARGTAGAEPAEPRR